MKTRPEADYDRQHMADCLMAHAHLCERIVTRCWDEEPAKKYHELARECRVAAAEQLGKRDDAGLNAVWPAVLAV